jgi:hypothetical protein
MTIGSPSSTHSTDPSALLTQLGNGTSPQSPVDLHPAIESVRRMPEFRPPQPDFMDEFLKFPLVRQFGDALNQFMSRLVNAIHHLLSQIRPPGLAAMPESIQDIFSGLVGFILILLGLYAFYIMLGWLLRLQQRQQKRSGLPEPRFLTQICLINSTHHAQKAREMAELGQYDTAIRQLYLAQLCVLDERALVRFEATRSNREYTEILSRQGQTEIGTGFAQISQRFEATHYGQQPVTETQFSECDQVYHHLEALAAHHG